MQRRAEAPRAVDDSAAGGHPIPHSPPRHSMQVQPQKPSFLDTRRALSSVSAVDSREKGAQASHTTFCPKTSSISLCSRRRLRLPRIPRSCLHRAWSQGRQQSASAAANRLYSRTSPVPLTTVPLLGSAAPQLPRSSSASASSPPSPGPSHHRALDAFRSGRLHFLLALRPPSRRPRLPPTPTPAVLSIPRQKSPLQCEARSIS